MIHSADRGFQQSERGEEEGEKRQRHEGKGWTCPAERKLPQRVQARCPSEADIRQGLVTLPCPPLPSFLDLTGLPPGSCWDPMRYIEPDMRPYLSTPPPSRLLSINIPGILPVFLVMRLNTKQRSILISTSTSALCARVQFRASSTRTSTTSPRGSSATTRKSLYVGRTSAPFPRP